MFRIPPNGAVTDFQTYSVSMPRDRMVKAACEQVGCDAWQFGWESLIDEATDLGQAQAAYIRHQSGRTFQESRTAAGLTAFRFESRQRCFTDHQTRPEVYRRRDGDWRGNPTGRLIQHVTAADWVEDFGLHQQRIAEQIERG